jgi:thiamine-phosphate pyrophosphorylase
MSLNLQKPIIYLITSGATTPASTPASKDFQNILALVRAGCQASIPLIQLREKNLTPRTLYELTARCLEITRGTETRLLVNDRADIARAAGADGCHLTTRSIEAPVVRRAFGEDFLIGVSTHSLSEARAARDGCADFAVFGPVFDTPSKRAYGAPVGVESLREAAQSLAPFPILALGGIKCENAQEVLRAGASGIAAVSLFSEREHLDEVVASIRGRRIGG